MAGSSCHGATCRQQQKQCAADAEKCPPSGRASFEQLAIDKRNDFHKRLCTGRFPVFGGAPEVSSDGSNKPSPMAWSASGSRRATPPHLLAWTSAKEETCIISFEDSQKNQKCQSLGRETWHFLRGFPKTPKKPKISGRCPQSLGRCQMWRPSLCDL